MNNSKLQFTIAAFVKNKKANAAYYDDNWSERKERKAYTLSVVQGCSLGEHPFLGVQRVLAQ